MLSFSVLTESAYGANPSMQENKTDVVKGKVVDDNGYPLAGAMVKYGPDPQNVVITDGEGAFTFNMVEGGNTIEVKYLGMDDQNIEIGNKRMFTITLSSLAELDEVVVTGVFNVAKESFTGAATRLSKDDLVTAGSGSMIRALSNLDATFFKFDDIALGSDPNALPTISMRGVNSFPGTLEDAQRGREGVRSANQPLFILNGFEISLERFMDLDENQVESIVLLKDVSATAMYGSRGANGVVVITTQQPKEGRLRFTYKGTMTLENPILNSYDLMNASEKLEYELAAGLYGSGVSDPSNKEQVYRDKLMNVARGVDTYWLRYPVRNGIGHRHSITAEGGDENLLYSAHMNFEDKKGAMKGSGRKNISGGVMLNYKLKNFSFQNYLQVLKNDATNSPYGNFSDYANANPYFTPYDDNGAIQKFLYRAPGGVAPVGNPLYNASLPSKNTSEYLDITNNFQARWYATEDLYLSAQFNVTSQRNRSDNYIPMTHTKFADYTGDRAEDKGEYTFSTGNMFKYQLQADVNYATTFAEKHDVMVSLGVSMEEDKSEQYRVQGVGLFQEALDFLGQASKYPSDSSPYGYESVVRRAGYMFYANYTYDRRYNISASGRYDGSSTVGSGKRFSPFWSVGAGWTLSQEKFMRDIKWIDTLRFRMSYGVSGKSNYQPYDAISTYRNIDRAYNTWYGVELIRLGNTDLKWSNQYEFNFGMVSQFLDQRISFEFDIYKSTTKDLITNINLPTSAGFSNYKANVGEVENKGLEMSLNAHVIKNPGDRFNWHIGVQFRRNSNKITKISNALQKMNEESMAEGTLNPSLLWQEGRSMNDIYAVRSKGIDPGTGREVYLDLDGNETFIYDYRNQVAVGNTDPSFFGNINTTFRYKGFRLSAYFQYRYGADIYNSTLAHKVENVDPAAGNLDRRAYKDRWWRPGDISKYKAVNDLTTTYATDRFVMKEKTFSLSSLSLEYIVPSEWSKRNLGIEYVAIGATVNEVFRWSTIKEERGLNYPYATNYVFNVTLRF